MGLAWITPDRWLVLGGADDDRPHLADQDPCRGGEPIALWIAASPRPELAGQPCMAGLGMQSGSPLIHELLGQEWVRHGGLLSR